MEQSFLFQKCFPSLTFPTIWRDVNYRIPWFLHTPDTPLKIMEEKSKAASKKGHKSLIEVVSRLRSSCKIRKGESAAVYSV
jgi:hypothetical protein